MTILPDLSDLIIEQVYITNVVTISVCAASPTASCPCCGSICQRVHSHYTRTLRDLPASGRTVHLKVQVRRFFCEEDTTLRHWTSYAHRTNPMSYLPGRAGWVGRTRTP